MQRLQNKAVNLLVQLLVTTMMIMTIGGCTITNKYGPYLGKVEDAETKEAIEGAAVLMVFHTVAATVGGGVYMYADAVETVTDKNGEFRIPAQRLISPGVLRSWADHASVTIFKPGYGCYPYHKDAQPMFIPNGSITENEYVTIRLPKLGTTEERRKNLFEWSFDYEVPYRKQQSLFDLRNKEAVTIGKEPWPILDPGNK